jgi:curved DNA-binding protein CbpA
MPGPVPASVFVKDYYSILRVSRKADIQTIKRSYRLLVQKYHPDVNPDPQAAELIKEINEAYDVLSDPAKKGQYDFRFANPNQQTPVFQQAPHRDPRYRKSYGPVKKENRQLELMKNYVHLTAKVSWAGSFICFFLLVDFFLPHRIVKDTVRGLYTNSSGRTRSHLVVSESGQRIKIGFEDLQTMVEGAPIEITETAITSIAIKIYVPEKAHSITSMATLYRTYLFVPILLLVTSGLGLLLRNNVELQFNVGIVSFILLIFTLILIFK